MKLNDKKYQGNEPPTRKKQVEIAVLGEPGLWHAMYPIEPSYVLTVTDNGQRRRITLKNPKPRDDVEAVMRARQIKKRLAEGLGLDACQRTVNEIVDDEILPFLRQRSDDRKNQRYCRELQNRFNAYWREPLTGLRPEELTRQRLQRIADGLTPVRPGKDKLSAATYNRALAAISVICKFQESRGYASTNPARGLQTRKENNRRTRILRDDELPRFFAELSEFPLWFQLFIQLLLHTWIRQGEAMRAKWSDVSWDQRTLILHDTKNGKPHVVPLSDGAIEVLRQLATIKTNDYLFPGKTADGHMGRPGRHLKALFAKAGVTDLWGHDLRRSGASWACRNGASVHDVSAILNHSNVAVTQRYVVAHNPRLQAAVEGVSRFLDSAIKADPPQ